MPWVDLKAEMYSLNSLMHLLNLANNAITELQDLSYHKTTRARQSINIRGQIMKQSADFFVRRRSRRPPVLHGSLMTFLVTSAETENRFFLLSFDETGNEPPPHLHYDQDEVLPSRRRTEVYCMGQVRTVRAGEAISPEPGARVLLPTLRFLALLQPGGLDGTVWTGTSAMSSPATSMELPESATTYALSDPAPAIELAARYGVKMLTRRKRRNCCSHHPGWGTVKGVIYQERDRRQERLPHL